MSLSPNNVPRPLAERSSARKLIITPGYRKIINQKIRAKEYPLTPILNPSICLPPASSEGAIARGVDPGVFDSMLWTCFMTFLLLPKIEIES